MTLPRGPASSTGQEHEPDGAGPGPMSDSSDALARLGRSWTWLLGSAVATLVPGILVLVWPEETLHVLAVLIGLHLLVAGAFRFVAVFGREEHGERLPELLLAVLYVLAGVLCLRNPLQTIAVLSLIVGVLWLVSGILTLFTAIATKDLPHRGVVLGVAVLGIVAGIAVLALPTESARALTRLLGLWLVLLGLAETAVALAWRTALRKTHSTGPHTPAGTA
ncbi:HdeD family acid-resistance protein [Streptomyces sp. B21-083]|uniref:HdeD family acid-resistance protein n=1 Tax=Streptomyces sp. B21-083 TaxID=3039410 RepID=UPI002FF274C2